MANVISLPEIDRRTAAICGPKMARLAELAEMGAPVPEGFGVTTQAFEAFLKEAGLRDRLLDIETSWATDDADSLQQASRDASAAIEGATIPPLIAGEIKTAYEALCRLLQIADVPVAVRSSATGEDAADASFAGQYDSYLGISGPDKLLHAIRRCWASLFTDRAMQYRRSKDRGFVHSPMGVAVNRLVDAVSAGVGFSADPVSGKTDRIVIEANWGFGEAVVQGITTPDHVVLDKIDLRVLDYRIGEKAIVSVFDQVRGAVIETEMPAESRALKVLDSQHLEALGRLIRKLEKRTGYPVDIEWVIERDRPDGAAIVLVQLRPVSTQVPDHAVPYWSPTRMSSRWKTADGNVTRATATD